MRDQGPQQIPALATRLLREVGDRGDLGSPQLVAKRPQHRPVRLQVLGATLLEAVEDLDDNPLGQAPETDRARFRDGRLGAAPPFPAQPRIGSGCQRPATVMGLAEHGRAAVAQPGVHASTRQGPNPGSGRRSGRAKNSSTETRSTVPCWCS